MPQRKDIRYLNRNFTDFRKELIDYTKNYFPDTYNDFSAASPGVMFIEMASYVGDVLSFYQDQQLQETFLRHAKNPANLYPLAYMMGYRPKISSAAQVRLSLSQIVDDLEGTPDFSQAGFIGENTTIIASTGNNTSFIIANSVNFAQSSSVDPTEVTINGDGTATLTKTTTAFSAEVVEVLQTIGDFERFKTITISDVNILGVLDIVDSNNDRWYEVPFLGQDTIIEADNLSTTPNTLKLEKVERRFVSRFTSSGQLQIQFGAGIESNTLTEESFLPSPTNIGFNPTGDGTLKTAFDPSNFLFTKSYGLAPVNTTLTIRYLKGGGVQSNEPAGAISQTFPQGNNPSINIINEEPATGGRDGDTVEEIRESALRAFAEQQRTVTTSDYVVRAVSLPTRFGVVSKAFATRDTFSGIRSSLSPLEVSLYVLSSDTNGNATQAGNVLKENLKKYLSEYIMLTDNVTIKDAFVVNIGIDYEISILPEALGQEVLLRTSQAIVDYFRKDRFNINQVIDLNNLSVTLDRVDGVKTVKSIRIFNKAGVINGFTYSDSKYDLQSATRQNVIYPSLDPCLFELKFPNEDIKGRIVSI